MTEENKLLEREIKIMMTMADSMRDYLMSETLFYPLGNPTMPRLTLGGYLLRQQRLVALFDQLTLAEQGAVQAAMTQYHSALDGLTVRFEAKAHEELEARLRQWPELIRDYLGDNSGRGSGKNPLDRNSAEVRMMISVLVEQMEKYPYRLKPGITKRLGDIDVGLRTRWQHGDFIWDETWESAYSPNTHWWLFGEAR